MRRGFCPSFITVENGKIRIKEGLKENIQAKLSFPFQKPKLQNEYNIIVTGIGGTGVVTIGALLVWLHISKIKK